MAELKVPLIATIIGEGGSGGALAIAVGDAVLMLQYATYSVISPEGCASILWKTSERAADEADALGETAKILTPEKRVLMPTLEATCSLDLGCPVEEFSAFCDKHPERNWRSQPNQPGL